MTMPDHSAPFFDALLTSAQRLSFDLREIGAADDALEGCSYGMTPEWSPLFETSIWADLSEQDRQELTKREVAHFLGVAIWLEVALQIVLLRRNHSADPTRSEVKFLFNECADENLHSLMFAQAIEQLGQRHCRLDRSMKAAGWLFRTFAWGEVAYAIVLAGEEIFDVMQRDWAADERVALAVRRSSYVHVVEESRHMSFARQKIRDHLAAVSRVRRYISAIAIAIGAHIIAKGLINQRVYEGAGMPWQAAKHAIDHNEHHRMMFRRAAEPFTEFLAGEQLLNTPARAIYRMSNLL
ncbi:diiron oxygenase [Nocardia sp. NPDC056100]|uniref:diiron oxygenase n=1 Tax=Nocardia sp. NPDC056100 TaxID=3345712 RepID=UPI0035D670E2